MVCQMYYTQEGQLHFFLIKGPCKFIYSIIYEFVKLGIQWYLKIILNDIKYWSDNLNTN